MLPAQNEMQGLMLDDDEIGINNRDDSLWREGMRFIDKAFPFVRTNIFLSVYVRVFQLRYHY